MHDMDIDDHVKDLRRRVAKIERDKTAPPCPHGFQFITQCLQCTPPLETPERKRCVDMMEKLGWTHVSFSQPFKAAQTEGIPDSRFYPPEWNPKKHLPFWFEAKGAGGKTNKRQKTSQSKFQAMCERSGEPYVRGGLKEVAAYLRENKIAEVGIR